MPSVGTALLSSAMGFCCVANNVRVLGATPMRAISNPFAREEYWGDVALNAVSAEAPTLKKASRCVIEIIIRFIGGFSSWSSGRVGLVEH